MRLHSQNLTTDYCDRKERALFWAGRAWFYARKSSPHRETCHVEWSFGKYARDFAVTATFGYGDSNADVCLHVCIPFLFSLYFIICEVLRCKEQKTGVAIHNQGLWIYPLVWENETNHDDPWWRRWLHFAFPWELNWYQTEILSHDLAKVVWKENVHCKCKFLDSWDIRKASEKMESRDYRYRYVLNNGESQERTATVHVTRMEWRARWWPIFRQRKVSTSIAVQFSDEVGEGTGSWKGGCTGCGYDLLPGETPEQCLRRMEVERKFKR